MKILVIQKLKDFSTRRHALENTKEVLQEEERGTKWPRPAQEHWKCQLQE